MFGFEYLKVDSTEWVSPTTKRIRFAPSSTAGTAPVSSTTEIGTALLTIHRKAGAFFPTPRPYTPISGSMNTGAPFELLIRQVPNGAASPYMCSLKPGDTLLARTISRMTWVPNTYPRVGLIAGGTGITPCLQMMRGILANSEDKTNINLVYGCRSEEGMEPSNQGILLKKEVDELISEHPERVKAVFLTTPAIDSKSSGTPPEPEESNTSDQSSGSSNGADVITGRITKEILSKHLPSSSENTKIFVSGPPALEKTLIGRGGILAQLGFGKDKVQQF